MHAARFSLRIHSHTRTTTTLDTIVRPGGFIVGDGTAPAGGAAGAAIGGDGAVLELVAPDDDDIVPPSNSSARVFAPYQRM